MDQELINQVKAHIIEYLARMPASADSLEGIHHWWIKWGEWQESQEVTEMAVRQLEAEGLLQGQKLGNRIIWRKQRA